MEADDELLAFSFSSPNKSWHSETIISKSSRKPSIINYSIFPYSFSGSSNTRNRRIGAEPTPIFGPEDFPINYRSKRSQTTKIGVSLWWRGENVDVYVLRGN
uniref:Uncharacterized protein n=1 Tax=Opuntia streptacantha TaxID=393608 RepID=A0A7C9DAY8_OPUST